MTCSNIVQFPADPAVATHAVAAKRRRGIAKNSIPTLSAGLIARAQATPASFHKLFLLRLEILVNELELDVEKYSEVD